MGKIYEHLFSTNILREKRQDSFVPQRVNLFGEDSICIVNLLEIPQVIVGVHIGTSHVMSLLLQFTEQ